MNILIVTSLGIFSEFGGGQRYILNLVNEFISRKIFPTIASENEKFEAKGNYNECKLIYFSSSLNLEGALDFLNEIQPDIVHAHGYKSLFSLACSRLGIPCIITAHHGGILCPAGALLNHKNEVCRIKANLKDCLPCVLKNVRGGIWAWPFVRLLPLKLRLNLGKLMMKLPFLYFVTPVLQASYSIRQKELEWRSIHENTSMIIAPSNAIARNMIINGADTEKIKVVPHGIPLPKNFHNTVTTTPERPFKFFYVGRISYVKGVHIMLEAFNESKINAELHIIGGAGNRNEERYMRRLKKKYKDDARITWHGKISYQNIYDEIDKYDIMIHPAICLEVFGLNIAEALALGKPVIATKCGGPEMQIEDGTNGILVEPNHIVELANAMERIANNKINLKVKIESVKSIEEHVHELLKVYEEITY